MSLLQEAKTAEEKCVEKAMKSFEEMAGHEPSHAMFVGYVRESMVELFCDAFTAGYNACREKNKIL